MELSLTCPLPLCQLLEPRQVSPCVFDTARNSISDELKNKLDALKRWIETHQQERIELRLKRFCVNDLVVDLPIVDLGLRERMQRHQYSSIQQRPLCLLFFSTNSRRVWNAICPYVRAHSRGRRTGIRRSEVAVKASRVASTEDVDARLVKSRCNRGWRRICVAARAKRDARREELSRLSGIEQ